LTTPITEGRGNRVSKLATEKPAELTEAEEGSQKQDAQKQHERERSDQDEDAVHPSSVPLGAREERRDDGEG
jgi:hypothetical protein